MRTHSPPTVFTPWARELELSAKKITIQKKSQLYLTLFRMLVTDWPGNITGIICYKSGRCDDCVMFQLCIFVFATS